MTNIRRYFNSNDIVFITSVTFNRIQIIHSNYSLLNEAFERNIIESQIELIASVFLPEHFHILISTNGEDVSKFIKKVKLSFSAYLRKTMSMKSGRIWQYRFWDRIIRDQNDLNKHIDYIHYNPIKHGLVNDPKKWDYSSFQDYYRNGFYADDWGVKTKLIFEDEFGE